MATIAGVGIFGKTSEEPCEGGSCACQTLKILLRALFAALEEDRTLEQAGC